MIAADARTPPRPVRKKLEEDVRRVRSRADAAAAHRRGRGGSSRRDPGNREQPAIEPRLPQGGRGVDLGASGRAVLDRAAAPLLVRCTPWDRTPTGERSSPARPDAERPNARRRLRAARGLRTPRPARTQTRPDLVLAEVARWRLERGTARLLKDGSAIEEVAVGGEDWLIGEILSFSGEAVLREHEGAARADRRSSAQAPGRLGLTRVRVPSAR